MLRHHRERHAVVCDPCSAGRRDYNPRTDGSFSDQLLALFDSHAGELVYPRSELGIALRFRYDLQNEVRLLRRRVSLRGDAIVGYCHAGGYRLVRKVDALPSD